MPNRNPTVVYSPSSPRRSQRLILLHENNNPTTPKPKSTKKSPIQSRTPAARVRKTPRSKDEVPSVRRSARFSNHKARLNEERFDVQLSEFCSGDSTRVKQGKTKESSGKEGIGDEVGGKGKRKHGGDEIVEESPKEQVESGVRGKRKQGGPEAAEGWTKEQELALRTAYFTAKPSPDFWKKVSKLVPGKSKQDCFDRVHCDFQTPPPCQPRSRSKTINSSPLHQFSISASKLLKPTEKKVAKSNILKPKSIVTQKSIENMLQRHLKADQVHKGDIFSVLEPNIDFSTNDFQPSQALCTPEQQKENHGFLQNFTGRSSSFSSHKKSLSRFSGSSGVQDLASPPVLKQVKNKVQHEKYVNQLRFRELKRRAASTRMKNSIVGEGNHIQKKNVVKAAKDALVSEARDAINKFQQSQVNIMDNTCSSDEDIDDDIGVECDSQ
ncbi:uncharacterized protein LOC127084030 [Lathyrus oleraceus]|uniref:Myb-like domain-containing protein n=1 Tax=Pisum sativum TaxID=3888 RepID=A0A9D4WTS6_PEA|nr:uncharacterized protein LOC127084030 [Pisum sativum]KAI5407734.1 hypothetical protein KIW84_053829 [Pisum sativum]